MSVSIRAGARSNAHTELIRHLPCFCYTCSHSRKNRGCVGFHAASASELRQRWCQREPLPLPSSQLSSCSASQHTQPHHLHTHHPNDFHDTIHRHPRRTPTSRLLQPLPSRWPTASSLMTRTSPPAAPASRAPRARTATCALPLSRRYVLPSYSADCRVHSRRLQCYGAGVGAVVAV